MNMDKRAKALTVAWIATALFGNVAALYGEQESVPKWPSHIQCVLDETEPLQYDRGERLPLYLWNAMDPGTLSDEAAAELVKMLNERGIGLIASWDPSKREMYLKADFVVDKWNPLQER